MLYQKEPRCWFFLMLFDININIFAHYDKPFTKTEKDCPEMIYCWRNPFCVKLDHTNGGWHLTGHLQNFAPLPISKHSQSTLSAVRPFGMLLSTGKVRVRVRKTEWLIGQAKTWVKRTRTWQQGNEISCEDNPACLAPNPARCGPSSQFSRAWSGLFIVGNKCLVKSQDIMFEKKNCFF